MLTHRNIITLRTLRPSSRKAFVDLGQFQLGRNPVFQMQLADACRISTTGACDLEMVRAIDEPGILRSRRKSNRAALSGCNGIMRRMVRCRRRQHREGMLRGSLRPSTSNE